MCSAALVRVTARRYPDRAALRLAQRCSSCTGLSRLTDEFAAARRQRGAQAGDRIAFPLPHGPEGTDRQFVEARWRMKTLRR